MQIIEDRRALHRIPELELELPKTMEYLKNALSGCPLSLYNRIKKFYFFSCKKEIFLV